MELRGLSGNAVYGLGWGSLGNLFWEVQTGERSSTITMDNQRSGRFYLIIFGDNLGTKISKIIILLGWGARGKPTQLGRAIRLNEFTITGGNATPAGDDKFTILGLITNILGNQIIGVNYLLG
jgi:hypothetical protein